MYADNELLFSYYNTTLPQQPQLFQDFSCSHTPNASMTTDVSEYDLGGEGDLFKAPQPIVEEPLVGLDSLTAAIPMISCTEDIISSQGLKVSDIESSFEKEQLLCDAFYGCKTELLSKGIETPLSDVLQDTKFPIPETNGKKMAVETRFASQGSFQKSVSSGSLSSMEMVQGAPMRPNFLDFSGLDFSAAYGMRRSFSEGDIKALGRGSASFVQSSQGHLISRSISEDRKEKLSRYRSKRNKRNFGRKIKYACRKALADSQPRIRGRFAKTEELDASKKHSPINSLLQ